MLIPHVNVIELGFTKNYYYFGRSFTNRFMLCRSHDHFCEIATTKSKGMHFPFLFFDPSRKVKLAVTGTNKGLAASVGPNSYWPAVVFPPDILSAQNG